MVQLLGLCYSWSPSLNANYNLLLGHDSIYEVGAMPSTLHQKVVVWREDGIFEIIEVDQSYYKAEVGKVGRKYFNKNLAKIPPCYTVKEVYNSEGDATYSLNLHPNYKFIWDNEHVVNLPIEEGSLPPTGWTMVDENDC